MTVKCAAITVLAVLFFGASGTVTTLSAQSAAPESVQVLKELVAEVRGLRAAIEQYANAQIQTQAVGELLDVQQRRVSDVTGRLDSARRELDGTGAEVRRMTGALSGLDEQLRRAGDPRERAQLEGAQRDMNAQLERLTDQDQMVRSRESELSSALGVEEAKWDELIDRLNQWLRR